MNKVYALQLITDLDNFGQITIDVKMVSADKSKLEKLRNELNEVLNPELYCFEDVGFKSDPKWVIEEIELDKSLSDNDYSNDEFRDEESDEEESEED